MILLIDFFKSVMSFFQMICDLISNVVSGLFSFLSMIPESVALVTNCVAYVPAPLVVFVTAGISICVVLHILNR